MLHSFKKNLAKASAPQRGVLPPGEFQDYKKRLTVVKRNIMNYDEKMTSCLRAMQKQMIEQRSFSENFVEGYPVTDDETSVLARDFAVGAQEVYDYYIRETSPETASFLQMQAQVQGYLTEIDEVEAMYKELAEAKSETARYQEKVDALSMAKKVDDVKKQRNLDKYESERQKYDELVETVVSKQKKVYSKAALVHRIALCAYWQANEKHLEILQKSMQKTSKYVADNIEELANIDISTVEPEETSEFIGGPRVPSEAPMSPRSSITPAPSENGSESPVPRNQPSGPAGVAAAS